MNGIVTSHSNEMGIHVAPRGLVSGIRVALIISIVAAVQSLAPSLWLVVDSD